MIISFPRTEVLNLCEHVLTCCNYLTLYQDPTTTAPGLWLIGDEGIYLASNGIPRLRADGTTGAIDENHPAYVVYANECNPAIHSFYEWRHIKRQSWGGDDGIEFLSAQYISHWLEISGEILYLDITPEQYAICTDLIEV